ncbi:MAG: PspC domain-containing protein [Roseiflexaceae bacterium]|nr:PspC domain-containing protein [Roseiflexaceae bacterium]
MDTTPRLRRSISDRMVGGVAGGLAAMLKIDPVIIRIAFLALGLLNGSGVLLYLLLWLIVPSEQSIAEDPRNQVRENASEMREAVDGLLNRIRSFFATA